MLGQKFSLFFMLAVECLVDIYVVLHLIENIHKNCAIILSALIIFIKSMIPDSGFYMLPKKKIYIYIYISISQQITLNEIQAA